MTSPGDNETVEDERFVHDFLDSCVEIVSVSMIGTIGGRIADIPPFMYVARAPGFDFTGIPGMGDEGASSSASDWRWGLLNDESDIWATLELWWPGGIKRRLKVDLQGRARAMFPMLEEIASAGGIAELGISNETRGIPMNGVLAVELDLADSMFRALNNWVQDQPPWENDDEKG